jgi:hypothetical protein
LEGGEPSSYYHEWGVDISGFAGQVGELRFSIGPGTAGSSFLDFIQFSTQPIPEPSALAMIGLGGLVFGRRLLKARKL